MQFKDLRVATQFTGPEPVDKTIPQSDTQILARWNETIGLLENHLHGRHDAIVFPFIWSNPFPFLLVLPPVRHDVAWWDSERTFNAKFKPAPEVILGGVDYVLVPQGYANPGTEMALSAAYGHRLRTDFRIVENTPHWALWARQDCARRALC